MVEYDITTSVLWSLSVIIVSKFMMKVTRRKNK